MVRACPFYLFTIMGFFDGAFGGIMNLFSMPFQSMSNRNASARSFAYQTKLNQQQADLEYNNWLKSFNAMNQYNDPSAQLDRLYAAGINPLSPADFSNISNAGAAGAPSSASPQVAPVDVQQAMSNAGQAAQNAMQMEIERNKADANVNKDNAAADNLRAQTDNITLQTSITSESKPSIIAQYANLAAKTASERKLTDKESEVADANLTQIRASTRTMINDCILKYLQFEQQLYMDNFHRWQQSQQIKLQEQANATDFMNAVSGRMNAVTNQKQQDLAERHFNFEMAAKDKELDLAFKRYRNEMKHMKAEEIANLISQNQHKVFGLNVGFNRESTVESLALLQAYSDRLDHCSQYEAMDIAGKCTNQVQDLVLAIGAGKFLGAAGSAIGKYGAKPFAKFAGKYSAKFGSYSKYVQGYVDGSRPFNSKIANKVSNYAEKAYLQTESFVKHITH